MIKTSTFPFIDEFESVFLESEYAIVYNKARLAHPLGSFHQGEVLQFVRVSLLDSSVQLVKDGKNEVFTSGFSNYLLAHVGDIPAAYTLRKLDQSQVSVSWTAPLSDVTTFIDQYTEHTQEKETFITQQNKGGTWKVGSIFAEAYGAASEVYLAACNITARGEFRGTLLSEDIGRKIVDRFKDRFQLLQRTRLDTHSFEYRPLDNPDLVVKSATFIHFSDGGVVEVLEPFEIFHRKPKGANALEDRAILYYSVEQCKDVAARVQKGESQLQIANDLRINVKMIPNLLKVGERFNGA